MCKASFFSKTVMGAWNMLPGLVLEAVTRVVLKKFLDRHTDMQGIRGNADIVGQKACSCAVLLNYFLWQFSSNTHQPEKSAHHVLIKFSPITYPLVTDLPNRWKRLCIHPIYSPHYFIHRYKITPQSPAPRNKMLACPVSPCSSGPRVMAMFL